MKTLDKVEAVKVESTETSETSPKVETRRPIPAPGRRGSFEEALEVGMKKYDGVLRELAK